MLRSPEHTPPSNEMHSLCRSSIFPVRSLMIFVTCSLDSKGASAHRHHLSVEPESAIRSLVGEGGTDRFRRLHPHPLTGNEAKLLGRR